MPAKLKGKQTSAPSPFDFTSHKTERSAVAVLMHWMREIIQNQQIDLGLPDVEASGEDRKMPDTVIYESRRSQKIICVVEAKLPYFNIFDEEELKKPAWEKANQRKAKYFAVTNFKKMIWFNTENVNALSPEEEQIIDKYDFCEIENLDDIEQTRYSEPIKKRLEVFLKKLHAVYTGKEEEPRQAIDEFLIFRLHNKIHLLSIYYRRIIEDQCHKDDQFLKSLTAWFLGQGWDFSWSPKTFEQAARQSAYLLVNKILFYSILQVKRPQELPPLEIPESLISGSQLRAVLQTYFDEVLKIDYETIYTTDFIDSIAFPDAKEVVKEIKELVQILKRYDFSKLGFEIIGRIFENLIPPTERHNLGQYFTNADVVDLILRFCLKHEDDKILDPSCGAGTFLVRAYQHKKMMNQRKTHGDIMDTLWGNDIAKFPAHLATINLAINDLGSDYNYPNILQEDFFSFIIGSEGFDPENWRKKRALTLGINERDITYPRWFDAIVGNPPYTRQEEIPETGVNKEVLIENALKINNRKIANIGKRAGIHAYFFIHGFKFLKENGYFGFIVSDSWLDVDYGKGLQEFFLNNYKIIAIIESKVERWFTEADINTCIVIMQKCGNKKERYAHTARFVYLKKPLRQFIPQAQDIWEKQLERLNAIDGLIKTIMVHNDLYENDELRIFPINQKDLWDEGYDEEEKKYIGAKWGKYLRAPEIFFKILLKNRDILVPLRTIADVRRGFTTGANEFFYLTEKEAKAYGIEKQFWMHRDVNGHWQPNKVIVSPREAKSVIIDPEQLKYVTLFIPREKKHLKGKNILKYIEKGEDKKISERSTCKSRKPWYSIEKKEPWPILFPMIHKDRQLVISNKNQIYVDHNFFEIKPKKKRNILPLLCFFLSTVSMLFKEFFGRTYGGGTGPVKTEGIDIERQLVIKDFSKDYFHDFRRLVKKYENPKINSIFEDLLTDEADKISIKKIRPERRELDRIVMGEMLGLTEKEQMEVYSAVVDLVKSRIEKAKSTGKNNRSEEGIDLSAMRKAIVEKIKKGEEA